MPIQGSWVREKHSEFRVKFPNPATIPGRKSRILHTALVVGGATFPLPPRAATLVTLPSATRFLACAAALGPPAPSAIAGRLAVADENEDERREAAMVDIVGGWVSAAEENHWPQSG